MNKDKLLNQLIDLIGDIEVNAFESGRTKNITMYGVYDKQLARHKTKAFKIIDKLGKL